jgi:pentatricopeptide repeat protein
VEATDPEYSESSRWIARSFEQKRDYAQALEYLIKYRQTAGAGSEEIAMFRSAFATGGWPEVLRASLPKGQPGANLEIAGTFAQLGQIDKAVQILEGMIKNRCGPIRDLSSCSSVLGCDDTQQCCIRQLRGEADLKESWFVFQLPCLLERATVPWRERSVPEGQKAFDILARWAVPSVFALSWSRTRHGQRFWI